MVCKKQQRNEWLIYYRLPHYCYIDKIKVTIARFCHISNADLRTIQILNIIVLVF